MQTAQLAQTCVSSMRISLNVAGGSFACTGTLIHVLETVASTWCRVDPSIQGTRAPI